MVIDSSQRAREECSKARLRRRARLRLRVPALVGDVATTGAGQVAAALGMVVLYRLLAVRTGPVGLGSFALVRQTAWLAFPVVMVGVAGGLPRAIGIRRTLADTYLVTAMIISGAATGLTVAMLLLFPSEAAALAFGSSHQTALVAPFAAMLGATVVYTLAFGYFRGRLAVRSAIALQLIGLAGAPVAVVAVMAGHSIVTLIDMIAAVVGGVSLLAILAPIIRGVRHTGRCAGAAALRTLWSYGYRRIFGELAQLALIVAAPIVVAHLSTVRNVAYMAAGQQLLVLIAFLTLPLGFVVLPTLGRLWSEDRPYGRWIGVQLSVFAFHAGAFVTFQAFALGPAVIRIWLGPHFAGAEPVIQVTSLAAGAYLCYLCLRSVLDAIAVRSYNSRNNLIALAVSGATTTILLVSGSIRPLLGVAWGLTAGLLTQGGLAFLTARWIFGLAWLELRVGVALALAFGAGVLGLVLRSLLGSSDLDLVALAGFELSIVALYTLALARTGVQWPRLVLHGAPAEDRPDPVADQGS